MPTTSDKRFNTAHIPNTLAIVLVSLIPVGVIFLAVTFKPAADGSGWDGPAFLERLEPLLARLGVSFVAMFALTGLVWFFVARAFKHQARLATGANGAAELEKDSSATPSAPRGRAVDALWLVENLEADGLPIHARSHPSDPDKIMLCVDGEPPTECFGFEIEPWLEGADWAATRLAKANRRLKRR
ncbi:MAG: hypothetical protein LBG60_04955 [Bifidobacteriaceae bacterium]|jgi:hypothetical protein|nr:hypothetical protein [Bifidobacteriaceae bacterium]